MTHSLWQTLLVSASRVEMPAALRKGKKEIQKSSTLRSMDSSQSTVQIFLQKWLKPDWWVLHASNPRIQMLVNLRPLWVWSPLRSKQLVTETVRMWGVSRRLTIASLLGQHLLMLGEDNTARLRTAKNTEYECYEWGEAEQEAEMQNLTRMPLVALVNTQVQFSAKILNISPRCPGQNCNFTALGCVIRASVNNAHFKSVLQSNTLAPQPWLKPWIYASVLAWDILGVNGPTVQWLTRYVRVLFSNLYVFP